jgi:hypothetical protein
LGCSSWTRRSEGSGSPAARNTPNSSTPNCKRAPLAASDFLIQLTARHIARVLSANRRLVGPVGIEQRGSPLAVERSVNESHRREEQAARTGNRVAKQQL